MKKKEVYVNPKLLEGSHEVFEKALKSGELFKKPQKPKGLLNIFNR